jgi:hypothetical protein
LIGGLRPAGGKHRPESPAKAPRAYFLWKQRREVDFLVKEGLRVAQSIQVWQADPSETAITARELVPFESRLRSADSGECLLITNDLERVEKMGEKEIRCVPLVLFLLEL